MTTKDEALALALQALKPRPGMPNPEYQSLMECAIEAIEEVQSRPEQEPVATIRTWHENGDRHAELCDWERGLYCLPDGEHNVYTSPPPHQWVGLTGKDYTMQRDLIVKSLVHVGINKHQARELAERFIEHTSPPPRQPLTDEQILHRVDTHVGGPSPSYPLDNSDWIDFARAIEAAHGIKENK